MRHTFERTFPGGIINNRIFSGGVRRRVNYLQLRIFQDIKWGKEIRKFNQNTRSVDQNTEQQTESRVDIFILKFQNVLSKIL
jgi:hypothetical protein